MKWLRLSDINLFICVGIILTGLTTIEYSTLWIEIVLVILATLFNVIGVNILANKKVDDERLRGDNAMQELVIREREDQRIALQNMEEFYNQVSERTEVDFIFEKIPRTMSYNEGKDLIDRAVMKYKVQIENEVGQYSLDEMRFNFNYQSVFQGARTYFDLLTTDSIPGPDPPFFHVHVLLNLNSDRVSDENRKLALRYRQWFHKSLSSLMIGNIRYRHVIILIKNRTPFHGGDVDAYEYFPTLPNYELVEYDIIEL